MKKVGWFEVTLRVRLRERTCSNFAGGLNPDFEVFCLSLSLSLSSFSIAQSQSRTDGRITRNVMREGGRERAGQGRTNAESNYIRRRRRRRWWRPRRRKLDNCTRSLNLGRMDAERREEWPFARSLAPSLTSYK